jgi:hypothetical protein
MMKISIPFVSIVSIFIFVGCTEPEPPKVKKNVQYVSGADEVTYIKLGKEITDSVGIQLKNNLMKAMQEGGPVEAVRFCNTKALSLTDSYSLKYNTEVKRVSDRNRNVANAPTEQEQLVIDDYRQLIKDGKPLSPKVAIDGDGRKNFYAPIVTGGMCLTCHGDEKNMQPELVQAIDSLYPNDAAKGFKVDELRGIWSVKFKNL